jgi:hypothetical protein
MVLLARRLAFMGACVLVGLAGPGVAPAGDARAAEARAGEARAAEARTAQARTAEAPPDASPRAGGRPSIVGLQPRRRATQVGLSGVPGATSARWTELDPASNAWFVLELLDASGRPSSAWHLENADPAAQRIGLDADAGGALALSGEPGPARCAPWAGARPTPLERARAGGLAFAPLCDGRLLLRNAVRGHRSALEATTELLRDRVWGGERIVGFVRGTVYRDAFVERGEEAPAADRPPTSPAGAPPPATLRAEAAGRAVRPEGLGLDVGPRGSGLPVGRWLEVPGAPGVHVSVLPPAALAGTDGWRADPVEAQALVFLVAFDLGRHELGFALGTEHPRLGWSARVTPAMRDASMPGPDGIDTAAPLARTGLLSPRLQARAVATFTGGFKREHGAFRYGALAAVRHGSHYGFVEQGVVFSRLVPGLSTLYVLHDGTVGMKTWTPADEALEPRIRDARQNGVPLVETPPGGELPALGALVERWGPGNWSGSADEQLRTLRAGACLIEAPGRRHLVYGWFSSATPATMARTFLAYGCRHAMLLDMNALEHTYLALYVRDGERRRIQHLVHGMEVLDRTLRGEPVPRFLGVPDDRDFFYVLAKEPAR